MLDTLVRHGSTVVFVTSKRSHPSVRDMESKASASSPAGGVRHCEWLPAPTQISSSRALSPTFAFF